MRMLIQEDLFGGQPAVTVVPETPRQRRRRQLSDTSLEAGRQRRPSATARERERARLELNSNGSQGRTHHELSEHLNIPLQTICWTVKWLLEEGHAFYPQVGWNTRRGHAIYLKRQGRKVLVSTLYRATYEGAAESVSQAAERHRRSA